jgi:DNA-binding NtrC family response regulator
VLRKKSRLNVLYIEDDADSAAGVGEVLSMFHDVRVASGLREAVSMLAAAEPDVVLCDLDLGPYRGDVLLELVAREYPKVRRVLFTGSMPDDYVDVIARDLAHAVITKPGDLDELLRAIEGGE